MWMRGTRRTRSMLSDWTSLYAEVCVNTGAQRRKWPFQISYFLQYRCSDCRTRKRHLKEGNNFGPADCGRVTLHIKNRCESVQVWLCTMINQKQHIRFIYRIEEPVENADHGDCILKCAGEGNILADRKELVVHAWQNRIPLSLSTEESPNVAVSPYTWWQARTLQKAPWE